MSKRKDIEAAWNVFCKDEDGDASLVAMRRLYEQGRIHGLREAAKMANVNRAESARGQAHSTMMDIRTHARKLAKKARGR